MSARAIARMIRFLLVGVLLMAIVCSCGRGELETIEATRMVPETIEVTRIVPQTVEVTRMVTQTVVVTQLVEVVVTATPQPAAPTPQPTSTPAAQRWDSAQVIAAFKAAGLEAESARVMAPEDYGAAPMLAVEGTRFLIPSLCADCGGRAMSFASQRDLEATRLYYVELGKTSALFFSWTFTKDNILVQINGSLPEATARLYEAALNALGR